ncbi:MAG: DUF2330 domain-containing protein [Planctomycetota bacterium]|jgi:hypothetical protein
MTRSRLVLILAVVSVAVVDGTAEGDGKLVPPREYQGSLEERAQEAVIVFTGSKEPGKAREDLILKITVVGAAKDFAWVVPFPREPEVVKADAKLFGELFDYVQRRQRSLLKKGKKAEGVAAEAERKGGVDVLSRRIVGTYDVAVVREREAGALNGWLSENGYRELENAEDVLAFYRRKSYVFACIKVSGAALEKKEPVDLHPLRFTFATGGRDGIYFPMKMTGLQSEPFDVNLYVFYRYWLNDRLSKYGYAHRGFRLVHRDWDTKECEPSGGKAWSDPSGDPYLKSLASRIPTVTKLMQARHPGERFYLTNIQASRLKPSDVRAWSDDLWLFPYYTNRSFVPYDARPGGVASEGYRASRKEEEAR